MSSEYKLIPRGRRAAHMVDASGEIVAKECGDCKQMLPLEAFPISSKGLGGRNSVCRDCMRDRREHGYTKTRIAETRRVWFRGVCIIKQCPVCGKWKPREAYHTAQTNRDGLEIRCKECHAEHVKRYAQKYPERQQIYKAKRRALKIALPNDLTPEEWRFIRYECFDNRCALTGKRKKLSMDHWIAISTGHVGTVVGNVYPLNRYLNSSKGDANPFEWVKRPDVARKIDPDMWHRLILFLAKQWGMDPEEFRAFTYWCYENPRTAEQIEHDGNVRSIDLFRMGR